MTLNVGSRGIFARKAPLKQLLVVSILSIPTSLQAFEPLEGSIESTRYAYGGDANQDPQALIIASSLASIDSTEIRALWSWWRGSDAFVQNLNFDAKTAQLNYRVDMMASGAMFNLSWSFD